MDTNLPPNNPPTPPAAPPLIAPAPPPRLPSQPPPRGGRGWRAAALILACLLVIVLVVNPLHFVRVFLKGAAAPVRTAGPKLEEGIVEENDSPNKIAIVPVEGVITSDFFERGNYGMVEYIKD